MNLPEEFMVDEIDQILGLKNLNFKVYINKATNLPENLCKNAFICYQFRYENNVVH